MVSMKSKISHYFASMALLSGFLLALTGIVFALSVHLTRKSDPGEIAITYGFIGFGLSLILTGINLMIKQPKEYHLHIAGTGLILNCAGIVAFLAVYPHGWVYPNVTYVAAVYAAGVCLLAGNAFANTVLNQIEERARQLSEIESEKIKSHSEDEIEKEVQKTLERSLTEKDGFSRFNMELKDAEYDFILGKGFTESEEKKVSIQDEISEVESLKFASSGKLEVLDDGLDSASLLLARATSTASSGKETKGIFNSKMKLFRRH
ncbi:MULTISPECIES: hypothetical protein [unclassified Methanosarcina]|jgi:hypothetical protein|uniref:DUF7139 domain-containing protein n=1 Tax=unclassified Methanosarcina TaxID=2644672 RepID=UPI000AB55002|nr:MULTISPECIES: hypothetical protein [unclassified Methanosarcina]